MKNELKHIAVIMDGNGRWATSNNKPRVFGHKKGAEAARRIVHFCLEKKIPYLSLYAFSKENWKRPKTEVEYIFKLFSNALIKDLEFLQTNKISLKVLGDLSNISPSLKKSILEAVQKTKNNKALQLIIALDYSGRWEIVNATKALINDFKNKKIDIDLINEQVFESYLLTFNIPNPDLLIRTGGEYRISNFLLWQIAYSEIIIFEEMWPEFDQKLFDRAIFEFQNRERRFGMTSEQVNKVI